VTPNPFIEGTWSLLRKLSAAAAAAACKRVGEYLSWVAGVANEHHGLVFDTEAMLASDIGDRSKFYAPKGRFYLLRDAQAFVGVGALQRIDAATAEVQRMYVQPPSRGRGAARLLLDRLLDDARAIGCDVVRLESLKSLAPAHALYRSVGFVEVPPHDDNRMRRYQDETALEACRGSAVFMELRWR
jgi:GNAT superfamily N-acetyltransferase